MKLLIFSLQLSILFSSSSYGQGQGKLTKVEVGKNTIISGQLLDQETGTPIPYGHIYLEETISGTISNEEGYYELKVPSNDRSHKIVLSTIGYETVSIRVSELKMGPNVKMKLSENLLDEVLITAKGTTPLDIINKVIENIPINYNQGLFESTYYNRVLEMDTVTLKVNSYETVMKTQHQSGYGNFAGRSISILNKRNIDAEKRADAPMFLDVPHWFLNESAMFMYPLNAKNKKYYSYNIEEVVAVDTSFVYKIKYTCHKPSRAHIGYTSGPIYSGILYVKSENFAVIQYEMEVNFHNKPKNSQPLYFKSLIQYEKQGQYYYLVHSTFQGKNRMVGELETKYIYHKTDFLLNDLNLNPTDTLIYTKDLREVDYDPAFWSNLNVVSDKRGNGGGE